MFSKLHKKWNIFNNVFSNNALLKLLKASVYISVFGQFSANNMQKRIKKYAGTLPLVLARNELLGSVSGIKRHGANFSDYVARPAS